MVLQATQCAYRVVTSSSLFDGHDASINVFRRLLQQAGVEVIHLGHNRGVKEIVDTALQEDADAICVSSYQGGHLEFFRYMVDLLKENHASHIQIFGGGGGTILPSEIEALHSYGVTRLYHVEDGQTLGGPEGIVNHLISHLHKQAASQDFYKSLLQQLRNREGLEDLELARVITLLEQEELYPDLREEFLQWAEQQSSPGAAVVGITGPGGAGKSSLVDELITRHLHSSEGRIGILAFDPTKKKTGGALLGDRIRMNSIYGGQVYLRSMATRGSSREVGRAVAGAAKLMKHCGFDLLILETSGIGQGDAAIVDLVDLSLYVMTSEYGASSQLEKIDMIDFADFVVVNKFDKQGALDAFEDVLHAYAHAHGIKVREEIRKDLPIFGTTASHFNDSGVTRLYTHLIRKLREKQLLHSEVDLSWSLDQENEQHFTIIPPERSQYLGKIAQTVRAYHAQTKRLADVASQLGSIHQLEQHDEGTLPSEASHFFLEKKKGLESDLGESRKLIHQYFHLHHTYQQEELEYKVRDRTIRRPLYSESLSNTRIPKIALPRFRDWGDILTFMRSEGFPGYFPYTSGVFQLKNESEDPKRQFAGEGSPARTNKRFHYLCEGEQAHRLSTAYDSVTLYGEDPHERPDIYGKVGNSGVSIATLDHMKTLFRGFDLTAALTSVSHTINGPAPIILAMYLNAAIDFSVEKETGKNRNEISKETYEHIRTETLKKVRGTVQADILKEEQAQNTCIFSSAFAIKMMGDIQEYFTQKKVRNFYSVSISGYHIAEAGANPITQLAFTLANGLTYVEYYLSRGMPIDSFAPNLSFFFSSGLDPEYSVIGRVARRIWAIALRDLYGANDRSCKLKYHIQTSGRSLHAQEIAFNDIRTTLQALYAIYDNCNSLHTNAYDEAITTPTEESVRRAMAIQLILTKEFGVGKCHNPTQGSFIYDELTDLVEEAVLHEFDSLSRRGGVLGAMEKQYQRHRIQTESLKYEMLKANGELPIIGINTFLGSEGSPDYEHIEVIRATEEEKQEQICSTREFIAKAGETNQQALQKLRQVVLSGGNIFEELMETVKFASLGQITHLLFECGGEYRRSM